MWSQKWHERKCCTTNTCCVCLEEQEWSWLNLTSPHQPWPLHQFFLHIRPCLWSLRRKVNTFSHIYLYFWHVLYLKCWLQDFKFCSGWCSWYILCDLFSGNIYSSPKQIVDFLTNCCNMMQSSNQQFDRGKLNYNRQVNKSLMFHSILIFLRHIST